MKPENILLDGTGHCLISDLGLARIVPGLLEKEAKIQGRAGTSGYWAPEVLKGEEYGVESDWWSYGCTVFALIEGHTPFSSKVSGMKDRDKATLEWEIKLPKNKSDDGKLFGGGSGDFVKKLLIRSPACDRIRPGKPATSESFLAVSLKSLRP